ncbi:hypothetical protein PU629_07265 [Pullulanibacillus sp. KACC 23026]|uniref:phage tail assembly chaperone G n=1 Tax=Pullulanibacillus sp. KACC 23026 TaxID=3028315 RepID=UPI0023AEFBDF|nr:hypothetical protein [Pullulanibacillus sp. KACC 23026]WEG14156.1 hypothetical protein PU629_07265 [Pullulanibacillus sp. KACC 23026]
MLRIELRNKQGEKVVKEQEFVPARKVREVLEMLDDFASGEVTKEVEALDRKVEFVAGLFPNMTTDDIYDGLKSSELLKELDNVIDQVLGREKKIPQDDK